MAAWRAFQTADSKVECWAAMKADLLVVMTVVRSADSKARLMVAKTVVMRVDWTVASKDILSADSMG
jgi:hypothetical protein